MVGRPVHTILAPEFEETPKLSYHAGQDGREEIRGTSERVLGIPPSKRGAWERIRGIMPNKRRAWASSLARTRKQLARTLNRLPRFGIRSRIRTVVTAAGAHGGPHRQAPVQPPGYTSSRLVAPKLLIGADAVEQT